MTTPTFDTIEAQASYGIGLQVGQQLSESGLEGLLPEALVAGMGCCQKHWLQALPMRWKANIRLFRLMWCTARCVKSTNAPMPFVVSVSRRWLLKV